MKLRFTWPNNNSVQDSEFMLNDYSYTQCYYNELLPADNYAGVSIPWDTDIANKLRLLKDDNIKAVISDDQNNPIFSGYIDSGIDFTKAQRLKPISLKLINPSFLLRQTIGETFAIKNQTAKSIVIQLLARLGGIVYNDFDLPAVIPIVIIQEDEEYYDVIETLLFEYGSVFDFDQNGKFTVSPIFNQPAAITNVFNGGNIRNQVQEICDKKEFNYIRTQFVSVSINPGDLVYEDKAEKEVPKGLYFGHESEAGSAQLVDNGAVYCEYQSSKGELLWADVVPDNFTVLTNFSAGFVIEKGGTLAGDVPTYLGNKGTSYAFRAKNTSTITAKIREIKAVGTSYTGIECYEVSKNGNLLKEYDSKYLQDKSNAASFTRNLSNYYRYSSIKLRLDSYADFPYGTFVKVSEAGIGEITARIVRKTYRMNAPIAYELESVTDFEPASITGEESRGATSTNSSGRGPDITPPAPPIGLSLSLQDDGKVKGTFTKSPDDDIYLYTVYRKTPEMPYKTVLTLDADINSFVDESAVNGMAYTYKVIATDESGNVSNPSNEASIGTVTAERPLPPAAASANAYEEYIAIAIIPPELASSGRDMYAPAEYKIQISRNSGSTYADAALTANTGYDYYFDRTVDGYPEIETLGAYRFRVYSVNIYGNVSATAFVCAVSTGDYATWVPTKPVVTGSGTGRTLYLEWGKQRGLFGTVAYRIQISLDSAAWYQPATTKDPYASVDNWRENSTANSFLEVTEATYYQVVPLTGQNTNLGGGRYSITPRTYYYRVMAINTESGKSSDWSTAIKLTAAGTSAQDLLNNSVGWDKIVNGSILMEKVGVQQLIGNQAILSLIVNDSNLKDKTRDGFQYWALADYTAQNADGSETSYSKGEFAVRANNGDFFIVHPVNGVSFKASRLEISALGSSVYGDFTVLDASGGNAQLLIDLLNGSGEVLAAPAITIGNASKKPSITLNGTSITVNGTLTAKENVSMEKALSVGPTGGSYVKVNNGMIELYQGGVLKAQMKLAAVAGVLSMLVGGLPLACEGLTSSGDINESLVSPNWTTIGTFTFSNVRAIAYGGGKFVAVGDGGKASYSADGTSWTAVSDTKFGTSSIQSIAYGGSRFVTVGSIGIAAYSADGVSWASVSDPTTLGTFIINAIAYGGSRFVAVGAVGKAAYSADGTSWTMTGDTKVGGTTIRAIAYGGGKFVAVGDSGKAAYSADGITWTAVSDPKFGSTAIRAIAYGGGKFVAVGDSAIAAYSADGITWTAVSVLFATSNNAYAIAYGEGRFVAVGRHGRRSHSSDGITWIEDGSTNSSSDDNLSIAYGGGKFVMGRAGADGGISSVITARLVFNANGTVTWVKA
jgi:hypothetical protein